MESKTGDKELDDEINQFFKNHEEKTNLYIEVKSLIKDGASKILLNIVDGKVDSVKYVSLHTNEEKLNFSFEEEAYSESSYKEKISPFGYDQDAEMEAAMLDLGNALKELGEYNAWENAIKVLIGKARNGRVITEETIMEALHPGDYKDAVSGNNVTTDPLEVVSKGAVLQDVKRDPETEDNVYSFYERNKSYIEAILAGVSEPGVKHLRVTVGNFFGGGSKIVDVTFDKESDRIKELINEAKKDGIIDFNQTNLQSTTTSSAQHQIKFLSLDKLEINKMYFCMLSHTYVLVKSLSPGKGIFFYDGAFRMMDIHENQLIEI